MHPREVSWLGRLLLLAGPTAAAAALVDVGFAVSVHADPTISVDGGTVGVQACLLGAGALLFTAVRYAAVHSRGRGTGMLLVGGSLLSVAFLAYLAVFALAAPVCDFGNGDSCSFGTTRAPLGYAVVRVAAAGCASIVPVATLVLLARSATFDWLTRDRPSLAPPLSTRPFALALTTGAGAVTLLATLHFPAVAVRLAGVRGAPSSVRETVIQAYVHAGVLGGLAVLVAAASALLAVLAWRGSTRRGMVRALGAAMTGAQVLWVFCAVAEDPVRLPRFGLFDSPVPGWFHVAQGVLLLAVLLAGPAGVGALVLASPVTPRPGRGAGRRGRPGSGRRRRASSRRWRRGS